MEAKHTEGPWILDGAFIRAPDGCIIADLLGSEVGEDDANGPLIAAAPDMLAALKRIPHELVRQGINFGPLIADAEDAIAKAEGK